MQALRRNLRPEFLAESRKHKAAKLLRQIPCIAPIRTARLIALFCSCTRLRVNWYFLRITVRQRRCSASGTKRRVSSFAISHFTRRSAPGRSFLRACGPRFDCACARCSVPDIGTAPSRFWQVGSCTVSVLPKTGFRYCAIDSNHNFLNLLPISHSASNRKCAGLYQTGAVQTGTRLVTSTATTTASIFLVYSRYPVWQKLKLPSGGSGERAASYL
jgi:hypothetical protein